MGNELLPGVKWVGCVDWNVRDFHGYQTGSGSTYNAYLILDEKTAAVDSVKAPFSKMLLENLRRELNGRRLDYLICNHAEPDHSGSLGAVLAEYPLAELVCNSKCKATLQQYYATDGWKFHVVEDGDRLPLGRRTATFMDTPMVHWPESMFTYLPEDKLLFSMDAFGQHLATSGRFDDETPLATIMEEARIYFANILMLYARPIASTLAKAATLPVSIVAPSHGVIWRRHFSEIFKAYQDWVAFKAARKVVIVYDTMWGSTDLMARAIAEGASVDGVEVKMIGIRSSHITKVAAEVLDAAVLAVGSPTLNMTLMPEIASSLTYLKGLKPLNKAGFAFGSYGWGKGGAQAVEELLKAIPVEILRPALQVQYVPDAAALAACREAGRLLAERALRP